MSCHVVESTCLVCTSPCSLAREREFPPSTVLAPGYVSQPGSASNEPGQMRHRVLERAAHSHSRRSLMRALHGDSPTPCTAAGRYAGGARGRGGRRAAGVGGRDARGAGGRGPGRRLRGGRHHAALRQRAHRRHPGRRPARAARRPVRALPGRARHQTRASASGHFFGFGAARSHAPRPKQFA